MEDTSKTDKCLKQMVDTHLLACEVEGKSPNTIGAYRETFDMLLVISDVEGFPNDVRRITPNHIYTYLGRILERGVTPELRHRRHREVRFFFSWLLRMVYVKNHPFAKIKNLQLRDKIVQPFSQQDVATPLQAKCLTPYLAARNRAIVFLLLDTGIRLNELVCLNIKDLDRQNQRLRILQGNGNKQRVVRVGDRALLGLTRYID